MLSFLKDEVGDLGKDEDPGEQDDGIEQALWDLLCHPPCCSGGASLCTFFAEVFRLAGQKQACFGITWLFGTMPK